MSSNIKTIYVLALEYLVAFYPIFLVLITYVCRKLHDNNFRPVVWLWKPFHRHFVHFRRRWDSKASTINVFFSHSPKFYLFTSHCCTLSMFSVIMLIFQTSECHALEYSILATIAVCVLVIFILFPTVLLIVYPTRLFRKCISCCGFRRWHALHMFMESFQGQYRDGTNGTHDFRMVSALCLILRILTMTSFLTTVMFFHHQSLGISAALQCTIFIGASGLYAVMNPYKVNSKNTIDYLVLMLLEIFMAYHTGTVFTYYVLATALLLSVPHMILIFYICYMLAMKANITHCIK